MPDSIVQPHSNDAELSLLCSLLLKPESYSSIEGLLVQKDFYNSVNGNVFASMVNLIDHGITPDSITITDDLQRRNIDYNDIEKYLLELSNVVQSPDNIEDYAKIIARTSHNRKLIEAAEKIATLAYQEDEDALLKAEAELALIEKSDIRRDNIYQLSDILAEYLECIDDMGISGSKIPTGFIDLDHNLGGGLHNSDLIVLAARTGMGKSSLGLTIARNVAVLFNTGVLIYSLEMSRSQVAQRILSIESGVDMMKISDNKVTNDEVNKLGAALEILQDAPIFIDDTSTQTILDIKTKTKRIMLDHKIGLVIVDYLGLLSGTRKGQNEVEQVTEISRNLKAIARDNNVPVLALSQLNREVDHRKPPIPILADLRSSGCLSGDTEIYNPTDGKNYRIDSLLSDRPIVQTINKNGIIENKQSIKVYYSGQKLTYKLLTKNNNSINATANHKFMTKEGWKRLDELTDNDFIALPRFLNGPDNIVNTDELALLGHLLGDGCVLKSEKDIYWDRIEKITPNIIEKVYDIEVKDNHNFVANGIIVHNSVEHDSDVVLMIYKEDEYDPETEKKDMAEIYIRKHRHGPTGTSNLYFDKATTRFLNLERVKK